MEIKKLTNQTDTQAQLTRELIEASQAYYGGGQSKYSDIEFDHAVEVLRALEESTGFRYEGSPTESVGAVVVSELKKVKHEQPALSLDKIKYADRDKLVEWLGEQEGIVSWKNDGLTVVVTYDNGKLTQAVTRGDGIEGSDITHNAKFFKGLPQKIAYTKHLVVRGEAVMSNAEFERVNAAAGGVYENARNLASATIQMLDANESKKREIRFIAFELVEPAPQQCLPMQDIRFNFLKQLNFNVVKYTLTDAKHILSVIEQWQEDMLELDYPTDGLVISYNNMEYGMSLGATGHHYKHSIALKWNDETKETTIRDIEWSVGKTGVITPVAIFDEVRLGLGSNVTRASLHNLSIMEKRLGKPYVGQKIKVYLANLIIPEVLGACDARDLENN